MRADSVYLARCLLAGGIMKKVTSLRLSQTELDEIDARLGEDDNRTDFIQRAIAAALNRKPCSRCKGSGFELKQKGS